MYVIITVHTQVSNILFTDLSIGVPYAGTSPIWHLPETERLRAEGVARKPEGSE